MKNLKYVKTIRGAIYIVCIILFLGNIGKAQSISPRTDMAFLFTLENYNFESGCFKDRITTIRIRNTSSEKLELRIFMKNRHNKWVRFTGNTYWSYLDGGQAEKYYACDADNISQLHIWAKRQNDYTTKLPTLSQLNGQY